MTTPPARAAWRPTTLTYVVGAIAVVVALIALAASGFGAFLLTAALFVGSAGIYTVATRRPSWLNLARSRGAGGLTVALGAVLLIVGATVSPHSGGTTTAPDVAAAQVSSHTPTPTATPQPSPTTHLAPEVGYLGQAATDAQKSLTTAGFVVTVAAADGSAHTDWSGWTVADQKPSPGTLIAPGSIVALVLNPPAPAPTSAPAAPGPAAPAPAAPAVPGPAPAAPAPAAPAPAAPAPAAPAPAPAPAAPAPAAADVDPGGYCSDADLGVTVTNSNGRSYTCGGNGPDAKGRYHWNK